MQQTAKLMLNEQHLASIRPREVDFQNEMESGLATLFKPARKF